MILGQLRMGARQAKNAALPKECEGNNVTHAVVRVRQWKRSMFSLYKLLQITTARLISSHYFGIFSPGTQTRRQQ